MAGLGGEFKLPAQSLFPTCELSFCHTGQHQCRDHMLMFPLVTVAVVVVAATALDAELACQDTLEWNEYHAAYERARDLNSERTSSRSFLAKHLLERTSNVTEVLSCNVGVVAGYYMLANLVLQEVDPMETGLAYRLLQLALIFIFTLRNANRIPTGPAKAWGVTEHHIIPLLMHMRQGNGQRLRSHVRKLVPISPKFRDPNLNIAIISICAYPADHPLALPKITPANRQAYADRHDYAIRLHLEHPIIGAHGLGVQHAKLATVLAYLQSNEFDWVAWLDCDSIIMNMNRTLDSIIYQYAQRTWISEDHIDSDRWPVCGEMSDPAMSILGEWLDSWAQSDFGGESIIRIRPSEEERAVWAEAPQIGSAHGRVESANHLEMDFDEGSLRAEIVWNSTGNGMAIELLWENGARWLRIDSTDKRPCREPCRQRGPGCDSELLDPEAGQR